MNNKINNIKNNSSKIFDFIRNYIGFIFIVSVIMIIISPIILSSPALFEFMGISGINSLGSNIGGLTSPIIGVLTALLLYLAFKESNSSNIINKENKTIDIISKEISSLEQSINDITYISKRTKISWDRSSSNENEILETYRGPITLLYFKNDNEFIKGSHFYNYPYLIELNYILVKFEFIHACKKDKAYNDEILSTILKHQFNFRFKQYLENFLADLDAKWDVDFQQKIRNLITDFA